MDMEIKSETLEAEKQRFVLKFARNLPIDISSLTHLCLRALAIKQLQLDDDEVTRLRREIEQLTQSIEQTSNLIAASVASFRL
jgi:hypothetical protein